MIFSLFYFVAPLAFGANSDNIVNYFRQKPTELLRLEYFTQVTKPINSSRKAFSSSEQNQLATALTATQKSNNDLGNTLTSSLGSRTIQDRTISLESKYILERNGMLNSLSPSVFVQKQDSQVEALTGSGIKTFENHTSNFGAKLEFDVLKNGDRSNGYLRNQQAKAQSYRQFTQSLNEFNNTYRQIQQNLLNLYSLNCRIQFTQSNQIKLEEAERKIDLAFKINMVTFSHVLNIRELLNSNEAQKQSLDNDLNRLVNYFNTINLNLGNELLDEVKDKFQCEFTKSFIEEISEFYKTDELDEKITNFRSNANFHINTAVFQLNESSYKLVKNKILPDFKPYLQVSRGNTTSLGTSYDDKAFEFGVTLNWGLDPSTIRDEILSQAYSKEASRVRLLYTENTFKAEVARIRKSIELRKKLILSAQKALEASDNQIKYNESQKGVKNIDTLTLINGFRTRIQGVTTLVDAFVALEQDYTELKIYTDWKYIENLMK